MSERVRCDACGWRGLRGQLVHVVLVDAASRIEIEDSERMVCPKCNGCDSTLLTLCHHEGCENEATGGYPSRGDYIISCYKHAPEVYR